jgi:predicted transcriptional regulator
MIPCEIVVNELLPTIRKQAAARMLKGGKSQRETAKELGLTEAAVSYYVSKKRGEMDKKLEPILMKAMDRYYRADRSFSENVCAICKGLRRSKQMCTIHRHIRQSKPEGKECDFCLSTCLDATER